METRSNNVLVGAVVLALHGGAGDLHRLAGRQYQGRHQAI